MLLDGPSYGGQLPCLMCRHSRRRKTREQWRSLCGSCRSLSDYEIEELLDAQDVDPDRAVVAPNLFRASRVNSDARYHAALSLIHAHGVPLGGRVLDVGCGVSAQADFFKDYRYVGADLNASRIRFGASQHPLATYAIQNITEMGFGAGAFEAVICLEVIEHLPEQERYALMRELFRVLSPSGVLVLSTPDGSSSLGKRVFGSKCERSHEVEMTEPEVSALVDSSGGRVVGTAPVDNLIQPAGRLATLLTHFAGDRARPRRWLQRLWSRLGYRTLIYTVLSCAERKEQLARSPATTARASDL